MSNLVAAVFDDEHTGFGMLFLNPLLGLAVGAGAWSGKLTTWVSTEEELLRALEA